MAPRDLCARRVLPGNSSECPPPGNAADDTVCLDLGKCKDGKCVPFCEREQRLESCACNGERISMLRPRRRREDGLCPPGPVPPFGGPAGLAARPSQGGGENPARVGENSRAVWETELSGFRSSPLYLVYENRAVGRPSFSRCFQTTWWCRLRGGIGGSFAAVEWVGGGLSSPHTRTHHVRRPTSAAGAVCILRAVKCDTFKASTGESRSQDLTLAGYSLLSTGWARCRVSGTRALLSDAW